MIVSDWIIESPDNRSLIPSKFNIEAKNKLIEYTVRDVHHKLRGKIVIVTLIAEYMPTVGFFFKVSVLILRLSYTELPCKFPANTEAKGSLYKDSTLILRMDYSS